MAFNLKNRHFLRLDDFTQEEIGYLLQLSAELKAAKTPGRSSSGCAAKTSRSSSRRTRRAPASPLK
jgi:ornithine carbamoyltransferase